MRSFLKQLQTPARLALLALILTGCTASPKGDLTSRQLPAAPAYVKAVMVARPRDDTPWIAIAAREKAGKDEANRRMLKFLEWYSQRRKDYVSSSK